MSTHTLSTGRTHSLPVSAAREPVPDGLREAVVALILALLIASPFLVVGGGMIYRDWARREQARLAAIEAALAYERLIAAAPEPMLEVEPVAHGRNLFLTVCAACHGAAGLGMPGLGRNLVESDFAAAQSDDSLLAFLIQGRLDARPLPMPPRGGRPDLTDEDLSAVVLYLRALQDPRRMPELPDPQVIVAAPSASDLAAALAAAEGDEELAEYIASGASLFAASCIACHGPGGVGVPGNGKPLQRSEFVASLDDEGLLAFLKRGRDPGDPANTTGVGMPPKGGNPALDEDDLLDIIAYLRTLRTQ